MRFGQVGCVLLALATPLWVWFMATVASLARPGVAVRVGYGCGLAFIALFAADVTALAVAALRPRSPDIAIALRDFEFVAVGVAAPLVSGMLAAFATLTLWPRWLRSLAAVAAGAYALRIGTLVTTDGVFAADGLVGLWLPVTALASWIVLAGADLSRPSARR